MRDVLYLIFLFLLSEVRGSPGRYRSVHNVHLPASLVLAGSRAQSLIVRGGRENCGGHQDIAG